VRFRFETHCAQITLKNGKVSGVQLDTQEQLPADRVIFNGDAAALRQGLLGAPAQKAVAATPPPRSLSAVTWALHAKTQGLALDRHNLFFWPDYASEFQDIFERQQLPQQPTVYLCAQDRQDQQAPAGPERLLCLVNAPATGDQQALSDQALAQCESQCLTLMQQCGLSLELTPHNHVVSTPQKFHHRFPATGGALYGQATHGWMSIFSRPGAQSAVPGLYLSGGSVHPGPGVPMAAMSGRLAAAAVRASLGLTKSFPVGATSGGMSTP